MQPVSDFKTRSTYIIKNVNYRTAQSRDAKTLALLLDIANYGSIRKLYSELSSESEWIDYTAKLIKDPRSDAWYGNTTVAIAQHKVVAALFTCLNPLSLQGIDQTNLTERQLILLDLRLKLPGSLFFRDLAVFPEYCGFRQIGMRLIKNAIEEAFSKKHEIICGIVHESNKKLLNYYKSIGCVEFASASVGPGHPAFDQDSKWLLLALTAKKWETL